MKDDIIRDFNLPGFIKSSETFADASKAIEKKFEGRNGKVDLDTKQELLDKLANAQEHIRSIQGMDDPQNNEYAFGAIAASLAPTLIDSLAPVVGNLFGKNKEREAFADQILENTADLRSDFAMGGKTNDYVIGSVAEQLGMNAFETAAKAQKKGGGGDTNWSKIIGSILQATPIATNIAQAASLDKPTTPRGSRVASDYQERPVDLNLLMERVNRINPRRALSESSGGDLGALSSNIVGSNLQLGRAVSDAVLQTDQINRQDRQFGFQAGQRRDMFNTQLDERFLERQAQDRGAYDTARSGFISAIGESAGAMGKEALQKELLKKMFGYDWQGNFLSPAMYGGKRKRK